MASESAAPALATEAEPEGGIVLRVKRRRDEDPLACLVVESSKRALFQDQFAQMTLERAAETAQKAPIQQKRRVFRLAGTGNSADDASKLQPAQRAPQASSAQGIARQHANQQVQQGRLARAMKVAQGRRLRSEKSSQKETEESLFKVLDVAREALRVESGEKPAEPKSAEDRRAAAVDSVLCNDEEMRREIVPGPTEAASSFAGEWVYDFYLLDPVDAEVAALTGAHAFVDSSVIEDWVYNDSDSEEDLGEADEDSNAEDHYGNDYPDTEEDDETLSDDDDDGRGRGIDELSTDDGEEAMVWGVGETEYDYECYDAESEDD